MGWLSYFCLPVAIRRDHASSSFVQEVGHASGDSPGGAHNGCMHHVGKVHIAFVEGVHRPHCQLRTKLRETFELQMRHFRHRRELQSVRLKSRAIIMALCVGQNRKNTETRPIAIGRVLSHLPTVTLVYCDTCLL